MTDIASKNEQELREIVISQSEAIVKLINQLEAQETISEIQGMKIRDDASAAHKLDAWRYCTSEFLGRKGSNWKAFVPSWGAPAVNKRYLVKLINGWICIATYYLRVGGGYWKDDRGQELADGVVSLWKGLEE